MAEKIISWWPLRGTLEDVSGDNNGNNNNSTVADGKMGKCYKFSNSSIGVLNKIESIPFSVTWWAMYNKSGESANQTIYCTRTVIGQGFTIFKLNAGFRIDVGSIQWVPSYTITYDNWNHYSITVSENEIALYVNGSFVDKLTFSTVSLTTLHSRATIGCSNVSGDGLGNYFNGYMNDLRLFNYKLSLKEIKEISKGKLLHYNFNDCQEPTDNLVYEEGVSKFTIHGGKLTSIVANNRYRIEVTTAYGFGVRFLIPNTNLVNNKTYTFSFNYKHISGGTKFDPTDWCDTTLTSKQIYDMGDYQKVIVTGKRSEYNSTYRFLDIAVDSPTTFEVWDLQCEQKEYNTMFTTKPRTGTVRDSSGFKNDSPLTAAETPKWIVESQRGSGAYGNFVGSSTSPNIALPDSVKLTKSITVSFWLKPLILATTRNVGIFSGESSSGDHTKKFGLLLYKMATSNNMVCKIHGGSSVKHDFNLPDIWEPNVGKWMYVTVSHDNNVQKFYINGVLVSSATKAIGDIDWSESRTLKLGTGYSGTASTESTFELDDFRIYATALSDNDVKELYQVSTELDNKGNLYTNEVVTTKPTNIIQDGLIVNIDAETSVILGNEVYDQSGNFLSPKWYVGTAVSSLSPTKINNRFCFYEGTVLSSLRFDDGILKSKNLHNTGFTIEFKGNFENVGSGGSGGWRRFMELNGRATVTTAGTGPLVQVGNGTRCVNLAGAKTTQLANVIGEVYLQIVSEPAKVGNSYWIYKNNVMVETGKYTVDFDPDVATVSTLTAIGSGVQTDFSKCQIDFLRIYDRPLTERELQVNYYKMPLNQGVNPSGQFKVSNIAEAFLPGITIVKDDEGSSKEMECEYYSGIPTSGLVAAFDFSNKSNTNSLDRDGNKSIWISNIGNSWGKLNNIDYTTSSGWTADGLRLDGSNDDFTIQSVPSCKTIIIQGKYENKGMLLDARKPSGGYAVHLPDQFLSRGTTGVYVNGVAVASNSVDTYLNKECVFTFEGNEFTGYIEPEPAPDTSGPPVTDGLYAWYSPIKQGATNASLKANPVLEDFGPNGYNLEMKNFDFDQLNGISDEYGGALRFKAKGYCVNTNTAVLSNYTIIAKRKWLREKTTNSVFLTKRNAGGSMDGAFTFEKYETIYRTFSFGGVPYDIVLPDGDISYQTTTSYNGKTSIKKGSLADSGDLVIGNGRNTGRETWEGILYELIIYNRVLTQDEIDSVIDFIESKYTPVYEELASIESTNGQYIDTLFKPNQNSSTEIKFQKNTLSRFSSIGGCENSANTGEFRFAFPAGTEQVYFYRGGSTKYFTKDVEGEKILKFDAKTLIGSVGTENQTYAVKDFQSNYSFCLHALNRGGVSCDYGGHKIFYCKLWDGDELVRDMIPVLNRYGEPGMLDLVSKRFFYNKGSGTFIANKKHTELEYLESTGTQWIDTGLKTENASLMSLQEPYSSGVSGSIKFGGAHNNVTYQTRTVIKRILIYNRLLSGPEIKRIHEQLSIMPFDNTVTGGTYGRSTSGEYNLIGDKITETYQKIQPAKYLTRVIPTISNVYDGLSVGNNTIKLPDNTIATLFVKEFDGVLWGKLFRHANTTTVLFSNANSGAEVDRVNVTSPTSDKYSLIGDMEIFKLSDGKYELMLEYAENLPGKYNRWKQTSTFWKNSENTEGYEPIDISWTVNSWNGFSLSNSTSSTKYDGCKGGSWWYAIGAYARHGGKIPGTDVSVDSVEVWIRLDEKLLDSYIVKTSESKAAVVNQIIEY